MKLITRPLLFASLVLALTSSSYSKPGPATSAQATTQAGAADSGKIKFYKSEMMKGETSPGPAKDSTGDPMVPVYENETVPSPSVSPLAVEPNSNPVGTLTSGAVVSAPPDKATPCPSPDAITNGSRRIKYYKSTMLAGEISQTPRADSMGMDMVPVYEGTDDTSSVIAVDPVTIQTMGVRTSKVTRGPLTRTIRTVGVVDYNEDRCPYQVPRLDREALCGFEWKRSSQGRTPL